MRERLLIALGGLLHDIGKFVQRARKESSGQRRAGDKDLFGYAHAAISYEAVKEILTELGIDEEEYRNLVLSACFHHKPLTEHPEASEELLPVRVIYRLADWYASVERSKELDSESEESFKRLKPVFEKVDIGEGSSGDTYFYKLSPLSIKEGENSPTPIFPVSYREAQKWARDKEGELFEEYYGSYNNLYKDFIEGLKKGKELRELKHKLSYIYHLMYKYTWCVPASIYDRDRYHSHYPDISLFDHSRVVAALASSLYSEDNLKVLEDYRDTPEKRVKTAEKLKLYLFEGDISGIQKFIYDISNIKGVAKRLRGRSVFLSFLPELVGRFILEELGYPWVNLLYAGGGKFQAVIGYEPDVESKVMDISSRAEEILLENFGGKLGFVVYGKSLSLSDLGKYSDVVAGLMEKGIEAKKRKFHRVLGVYEDLVDKEIEGSVKICPSCSWEIIEETGNEEKTCGLCESFKELGDAVVKSNFVVFSKRPINTGKGLYLKDLGGIYFLRNLHQKGNYEDAFILNEPERLESEAGVTGFRFLANVVPTDDEGVKSFEELAEEIEDGDQKLAFVLADVDNLGYVFMMGLGKDYTISRVATLSRSVDLFFSGYLNTLFSKPEHGGSVYTLYAGGDDLFIVAPWNTAIEVMKEVRTKFGEFVCENPSFGLSCGMYITGGNYPVRLAYEGVKREEDRAKNNRGKDSVSVLGEVLKWEALKGVLEETNRVAQDVLEKQIGRTNLYRVYMLLREYKELGKKGDERRLMFYPFFYYYLVRNVKEEYQKELESLFLDAQRNYQVRDTALFSAKYVLMRTRNVRT